MRATILKPIEILSDFFRDSANTKTNIWHHSGVMYVLVGPCNAVELPFTSPKQFELNFGGHKVDFSLRTRLFWCDRKLPKVVSASMVSISNGIWAIILWYYVEIIYVISVDLDRSQCCDAYMFYYEDRSSISEEITFYSRKFEFLKI